MSTASTTEASDDRVKGEGCDDARSSSSSRTIIVGAKPCSAKNKPGKDLQFKSGDPDSTELEEQLDKKNHTDNDNKAAVDVNLNKSSKRGAEEVALWKCHICSESFSSWLELKLHTADHGNIHSCKNCRKSFSRLQDLRKHKKSCFTDWICGHCHRMFDRHSFLRLHMKRKHSKDKSVEQSLDYFSDD